MEVRITKTEFKRELIQACSNNNTTKLISIFHEEYSSIGLILAEVVLESYLCTDVCEQIICQTVEKGYTDVVQILIEQAFNFTSRTHRGYPVQIACRKGHIVLVKNLIYQMDQKKEPWQTLEGSESLVTICTQNGRLDILELLVNRGIALEVKTVMPLPYYATINGHQDVLRYLLQNMNPSFDVNTSMKTVGNTEHTFNLLHIACVTNQAHIIRFLIEKRAKISRSIVERFPECIARALEQKLSVYKVGDHEGEGDERGEQYSAIWNGISMECFPAKVLNDNYKSIVEVELSSCELKEVAHEIYLLENVVSIDLSLNCLEYLDTSRTVEWNCSKLEILNASKNRIQFIPNVVFTSLPLLIQLDLSYNRIEEMDIENSNETPEEKWNLSNLEFLDVSNNSISILPESLSTLQSLRTFQANRNIIKYIPKSFAKSTHKLETLNLAENKLETLPKNMSRNWSSSLQTLILKDNLLYEISPEVCQLNHLQTLILSHNRIRFFPQYTEWQTQTLQKLDVSHNKLFFTVNSSSTPDERKFAKGMNLFSQPKYKQQFMPKAQSMDFSSNPSIEETYEIPVELWANTLMYLDLSGNKISILPDYIGNLTSLVNLNLSNNKDLTTLPPALGRLKNCFQLGIDNLRLNNLPHTTNIEGSRTKVILHFLHTELRNSVPSRRMKLMVVGLAGQGKTTLLQALKSGGSKTDSPLHKSTATNGIEINKWTLGGGKENKHKLGPQVEFSTWDLGGQEVYYATHQCFLTKNTLYLLVFKLTDGEEAILQLQPWLLNIQARAPNSPVIIVGTHVDEFKEETLKMNVADINQKVEKLYFASNQNTYPKIITTVFVSCTKSTNIDVLTRTIYESASNLEIADTKEKVIGQLVPKSYLELHYKIDKEREVRRNEGKMLILHYGDMERIASTVQDEDLHNKAELDRAASFLHNNGYILHYEELIGQLSDLYFIDPTWICDMFAQIVTVKEKNNWVKNGIIKETDLQFIFQNQEKYLYSQYNSEYLYIMEKFEILIDIGDGRLLIPSMLPLDRPHLVDEIIPNDYDLELRNNFEESEEFEGPITITKQSTIIRRRFYFSFIPSGFWNRLLSRILVRILRREYKESVDFSLNINTQQLLYWRRGIAMQSNDCRFVIESISKSQFELGGMQPGMAYKRNTFLLKSIDFEMNDCMMNEGVDIVVHSNTYNFSWMGYLVDQVENVLNEWFPGLDQQDVFGVQQVRRYCPWKVPKEILTRLDEEKKVKLELIGEDLYYMFQYQHCVLLSIKNSHILCEDLNVKIPLDFIIPEACLADLHEDFKLNVSQFKFERNKSTIGEGATATVFKGTYKNKEVAVKEFSYGASNRRGHRNAPDLSEIDVESTLQLLRMMRKEVSLQCRFQHPFILQLLAASIRPLVIVLELAPLGALSVVLSEKANKLNEEWIEKYNATAPPPMPGGVLGHRLTMKIALQIILAIEYLHTNRVIYRDLKAQNILLFSLDEQDAYNVKLSDYGISMVAQPSYNKGQEGTPGFIPPEAIPQKNFENVITTKADIFAYGMVMYELITGRYPFYPRTGNQEIFKAVLNNQNPDIYGQNRTPCCPNLIDLMYECWRRTPSDRPSADTIKTKLVDPAFFLLRNHIKEVDKEGMHKVDHMLDIPHSKPQMPNKTSNALCVWGSETDRKRCSLINVENGKKIESRLPAEQPVEAACVIEEEDRPPRIWISSRGQRATKEAGYREIEIYGQMPRNGSYCCLWRYNVKDTVLCLRGDKINGKPLVYASLLSGHFLAYARSSDFPDEREFTKMKPTDYSITSDRNADECEQWNMVFKLQIGNSPVHSIVVVGEEIWCTCGGDIHLLDRKKRDNFHKINVCQNKDIHLKHLLHHEGIMYATTFKGNESDIIVISVDAKNVIGRICCMEINPYEKVLFKNNENVAIQQDNLPRMNSEDNTSDEDREAASLKIEARELHSEDTESSKKKFIMPPENANLRNYPKQNIQHSIVRLPSIRADKIDRTETNRKKIRSSPTSMEHEHREVRVRSIIARDGLLWVSRAMGDVLLINIRDKNTSAFGEVVACLRVPHGDKTLYSFKSLSLLCQTQNEYVANYQQLVMNTTKSQQDHIIVWEGMSLERLEEIMEQNKSSIDMHLQRPTC